MRARDERLVFSPISKCWEIAHKETTARAAFGATEAAPRIIWVRRDGSWICNTGDEVASVAMPPRPVKEIAR